MPWQERNWIILREKQIEKFKQKKAREWVERQKKTKSYKTQTATQSQSDYNHNEAKLCLPKSAIFDAVVRTVNSAVSTKTNTHTHNFKIKIYYTTFIFVVVVVVFAYCKPMDWDYKCSPIEWKGIYTDINKVQMFCCFANKDPILLELFCQDLKELNRLLL